MKNWSILWRFRKPLEFFVPQLKDKFDEAEHNQKLEAAFKTVFNTSHGETILQHLINEYRMDEQIGNIPADEVSYISAQQDVVKYILSLVN